MHSLGLGLGLIHAFTCSGFMRFLGLGLGLIHVFPCSGFMRSLGLGLGMIHAFPCSGLMRSRVLVLQARGPPGCEWQLSDERCDDEFRGPLHRAHRRLPIRGHVRRGCCCVSLDACGCTPLLLLAS